MSKNTVNKIKMNSLFLLTRGSWKLEEQILTLRTLSIYLQAGLPLAHALNRIEQQSRNKKTKHILAKTRDAVLSGNMLSVALIEHATKINPVIYPMLKVGEYSGSLPDCLMDLSISLTEQKKLRAQIMGSAIYPAIIAGATLCISVFLLLYVFPTVLPILSGLQTKLPFATQSLIYLSRALGSMWTWVCSIAFLSLFVSFRVYLSKNPRLRTYHDSLKLRIPVFGKTLQNYHLAQIAHTLALLLARGIPVGEALYLTSQTMASNQTFSQTLSRTAARVEQGEFLAACLSENSKLFPASFTDILATGEQTGTVIESLKLLHTQHRDAFERQNQQLLTLLEPILMLFMGIVVGYIALAILMPVYQISHVMQ